MRPDNSTASVAPHRLDPSRRRRLLHSLAAMAVAAGWRAARANTPDLITLVVPHEPGGGMDVLARKVAASMSETLGTPIIVANRPGASGLIGTSTVARAPADGRTLLFNGVGHLASPLFHEGQHYAPLDDFAGVTLVGVAPSVLLTQSQWAGSPEELVRRMTDGETYGSPGFGSTPHLAAELFCARRGLRWLHVPYKGTGPALRALMSGEVRWMFAPSSSAVAAAQGGRLRAVAVAGRKRLAALPTTPTLEQLGIREADMSQWYALFAPRGTPASLLARLASAAERSVRDPALASFLRDQAVEGPTLSLGALDDHLRRELRRLEALARTLPAP